MDAQRTLEPEFAHPPHRPAAPSARASEGLSNLAGRRYSRMRRVSGGGGMELYQVEDELLGRGLTLGLLHRHACHDEAAVASLEGEARMLARIDHPRVVHLLDYAMLGHERCLVLSRVGEYDLKQYLGRRRTSEAERLAVLLQAAEGLAGAHAAGVLHGNVNAAAVRVDDEGRVQLVHFALARLLDPEPGAWERNQPCFAGDPATMAPEAHQHGRRDALTDQYSFCVVAWEALTGARPPADADAAARTRGASAILAVLARGLRREPSERWPDMNTLIRAMRQARGKGAIGRPRTLRRGSGRRAILGLLTLLAIAALSLHAGLARAAAPDNLALAAPSVAPGR